MTHLLTAVDDVIPGFPSVDHYNCSYMEAFTVVADLFLESKMSCTGMSTETMRAKATGEFFFLIEIWLFNRM